MKPKAQERGQALVIIALAAIGLFGFSALAIDGSRVFSDRRHAQNAADTAALSAALAKIRADPYEPAAINRAEDNGYANDANSTVEVFLCSVATNPPCQGIPAQTHNPALEEEKPANYIQVKITSILPATFGRIIGRNEFTNVVTAIAYAGPVAPKPLAEGYAIAAMELHDPDAVMHGGNFDLIVNNSGIFSNSDYISNPNNCNQGSMSTGGNGTISVDTSIQTVGSFCQANNATLDPVDAVNEGVSPIDMPLPVDIPNFSCGSTPGSQSTDAAGRTIISPGNHNSKINLVGTGEVIFSPGTHCFHKGLSMLGPKVIADNVKFLFSGGDFSINAATLTCNDVQVHVNGGSGVRFGSTSHIFCNNVTFFLSTGDLSWSGNPEYRMYAPTGGDYKGLLFYMPPSNSNAIKVEGNSNCVLTGTILAVSSNITVNGNTDWTGLNSQIIGDTVKLTGTGDLVINYDPDDQYQPIDPSSIMLTK